MADSKKIKLTNSASAPRGIHTLSGYVELAPGESRDVELSAGEADNLPDYFGGEGGEASEPGPLDGSIDALSAHIDGIDDADEIQALIDAETAGKSRKGALDALNARLDAITGEE